ncbi:zinc finger protein 37-like isoform X2 [Toxorhynchites rutilus septentrionalis]|uniref:zinc finger protein 37-like isoform X2 n=1 Tax=Toxorhynchites rutilus septentrionalis TaxID=329112 RepID=UPI00247B116C|nr:zinc finger protein 37-like isoform X2 [Toxorhynchites rutilus septentrionalis]
MYAVCAWEIRTSYTLWSEKTFYRRLQYALVCCPTDKTLPLGVCAECAFKVKGFFEFRQSCLRVQRILQQKSEESCKSRDSETFISIIKSEESVCENDESTINKPEIDIDDETEEQIDEADFESDEIEEQLEELNVIKDRDQLDETNEEIEEAATESDGMLLDNDSSQGSIFDVHPSYEKTKQEVFPIEMIELLNYNEQHELRSIRASKSSAKKSNEDIQSGLENDDFESTYKKKRNKSRDGKEIYRSLLMTCEICGKSVERNRMEGHHNQHLNLRPYACNMEDCGATFDCKIKLRLHTNSRHSTKQIPCDLCGKVYVSKKALYRHKRATHDEKKFTCEQCGLVFFSNSPLKRHQITHLDQREYKCPHCPKAFYRNSSLKVHLRSHTKEKPFACNSCDKAFGYNRLLKDHISRQHKDIC